MARQKESLTRVVAADPPLPVHGSRVGRPAKLTDWLPQPVGPEATKALAKEWADEAQGIARQIERDRVTFEGSEGELSWRLGHVLNKAHSQRGWRTLGDATFADFVTERVGMDVSWGYDLMFFSRVVTEPQARFGIEKALSGLALAHLLGAGSLAELYNSSGKRGWTEPAAFAKRLGERVNFETSTARRLGTLVLRLRDAIPNATQTEDAKARAKSRATVIERHVGRSKALAALEPYAYAYGGDAPVKHKPPRTTEQFRALADLYRALERT